MQENEDINCPNRMETDKRAGRSICLCQIPDCKQTCESTQPLCLRICLVYTSSTCHRTGVECMLALIWQGLVVLKVVTYDLQSNKTRSLSRGFDKSSREISEGYLNINTNVCPVVLYWQGFTGWHGRHGGWDYRIMLWFYQQCMCSMEFKYCSGYLDKQLSHMALFL